MENIWKVILGIFISVMIVFSGLAILEANNELMAAEQYLYAAANEISASNFAKTVSDAKIADAKSRNYVLSVQLFDVGEGRTKHTAYAVLSMEYPYEIALIGLHATRTKQIIVY